MRCTRCRGPATSRREGYNYTECGLDYITLVNVEVLQCQDCGDRGVVIPNIEELHRVIARTVARSPWHLRGREIRFLRKYLGFSSADFANAMATRPETVSRWENDKADMSEPMERFLKLLVFNQKPAEEYPPDELIQAHPAPEKKVPVRIRHFGSTWKVEPSGKRAANA